MGPVDLSVPPTLAIALAAAVAFPIWLYLSARIAWFGERHALRFLASAAAMAACWVFTMMLVPACRPQDVEELAGAAALLLGAVMFYLQVWGLLTRGYSLGILLALQEAGRPLTAAEIATRYRSGEGLQWIMHHRLGGLVSARMILREGDSLTLTGFPGALVARLYGLAVRILGLERTG